MNIKEGQFVIGKNTWGYEIRRVDALTPKLVKTRNARGKFSQLNVADIIAVFDDETSARKADELLGAARRHRRDDLNAAQAVFDAVKRDVYAARKEVQDRLIAMFAEGQIPEAI